jgi:hypothetical protein
MKNILIFSIVAFLLNACGGGSGGNSTGSSSLSGITPDKGDTNMVLNQQYVVSKGDQIFKKSDLAKVKIIHSDGNTRSTVELIEGSATLRNN